jgi:hypothetical protein
MNEAFGNKFVGERFLSVDKKKAEKRESIVRNQTKVEGADVDRLNERLKPSLERLAALEAKSPERFSKITHKYLEEAAININDPRLITKLAKSLYESEKRIAIERGHGADIGRVDQNDTELIEKYESAILDKHAKQIETLESWFNYLEQNDANYPFWFRYYAARSLRDMGKFERDTTSYSTRTEDTMAPFPELNAEALAFVHSTLEQEFILDHGEIPEEVENKILSETVLDEATEVDIERKVPEDKKEEAKSNTLKRLQKQARKEFFQNQKDKSRQDFFASLPLNEERRPELEAELNERLSSKNFAKLYAFAQVETAGNIDRESLEGEWVKYDMGTDPSLLEKSLKGKGTGWCTAEGAAAEQLSAGDFYVYFTQNKAGIPTEPRIAIRMLKNQIAEIRGIDPGQELEPALIDIAKEKYKKLPGSERYEQATSDMKMLTSIHNRSFTAEKKTGDEVYRGTPLTKEEFLLLYEVKRNIVGFGYNKDPRIEKLKAMRDFRSDCVETICENDESLLATNEKNLTSETRVLLGDLTISNNLNPELVSSLILIKGETFVPEIIEDKNLSKRFFNVLFNTSQSSAVLNNFEKFVNCLDIDIAKQLIEIGQAHFLADNVDLFHRSTPLEIAKLLIERGKSEVLADNLNKFSGLDQEAAMLLIENGRSYDLVNNLEKFTEINYVEIVRVLIERGDGSYVINNISKFNNYLDKEMAFVLLKEDGGYFVASHLNWFSDLDNETAMLLIENGRDYEVITNLEKFQGINNVEVIRHILEKGNGNHLPLHKNLDKFHNLDKEVALLLIEKNQGYIVAGNLEKFSGLDNEVAALLIKKGKGEVIADNLDKFPGITYAETARLLIENDKGYVIADNLDKFPGITYAETARLLIENDQIDVLTIKIAQFDNLDQEVAMLLINNRQHKIVADNLNKFSGLDQEVAALLINKGVSRNQIKRNLDSFNIKYHKELEGLLDREVT